MFLENVMLAKKFLFLENVMLAKKFFRYVSLNVLSMAVQGIFILADTFFISDVIGNQGIIALNLILPIFWLITGLGLLMGVGAATRFSVAIGSGNKEYCSKIFSQTFFTVLIFGVVFFLGGIFFLKDIVVLLGASGRVASMAHDYLLPVMCMAFPFMLAQLLFAFLKNDGNPRLAMMAMVASYTGNILLEYLFLYKFEMGMQGLSWARCCEPVICIIVMSLHFFTRKNNFFLQINRFSRRVLCEVFSTGISAFVSHFSISLSILACNMILLRLVGESAVGVYGIIVNISFAANTVFTGIAYGVQPLIGNSFGEHKIKTMKLLFCWTMIVEFIVGGALAVVGIFYPQLLINLFYHEQDPVFLEMALNAMKRYAFSYFLVGINIAIPMLLSCVQQSIRAFVLSSIRAFLLAFPAIFVLSLLCGIDGVWSAIPVTEFLTIIIGIVWIRNVLKKIKI